MGPKDQGKRGKTLKEIKRGRGKKDYLEELRFEKGDEEAEEEEGDRSK